MNLIKFLLFFCTFYPATTIMPSFGILDYFKSHVVTPKKLMLTSEDERKQQLEQLKQETEKLKEAEKEYTDRIQSLINSINQQIKEAKEKLKTASGSDLDFLNKELALLNEAYQTLLNIQLSKKESISQVEQQIKSLEEYLKDPDYTNVSLKPHAFYTYRDYQEQSKKIIAQEERIQLLQEQKNEAILELENRTRRLNTIKKEYQEKKKEQEAFTEKSTTQTREDTEYRKKGRIIDLEEKFLQYEKELAEQRIEEINKKIAYLNTALAIENEKLRILKSDLTKIRSALRIDQKDIQEAQEKLDETQIKSIRTRDIFYQNIKELSTQKDALLKELELLKKKYETVEIITAPSMNDWSVLPATAQEYVALCDIGFKQEQIDLIDTVIDHLRAQIDLEKSTYRSQEINLDILKNWYKITRRKFRNQEEIMHDLKQFQGLLAEIKREENVIKDRRNNATNILNVNNKSLTNLKSLVNDLKAQKDKFFAQNAALFTFCLTRLGQAYTLIEEQIRRITNIIKEYSSHASILDSTIQDLTGVIAELETKSIWQRSEYAISWEGIRNITSDLHAFYYSLVQLASSFFAQLNQESIKTVIQSFFKTPYDWIIFIIRLFIIIGAFFLARLYLPVLSSYLLRYQSYNRFITVIYNFAGCIVSFIWFHLLGIYLWLLLLILVLSETISSIFLQLCFYLGSIVYLCYLTYQFIHYIINCNAQNNYIIFNPGFESRFRLVFSLFGYLSVILLLFRQAYMLITYHISELPVIILASYSIFIRILIIFSIGKEEILSLIPAKGDFGKAVAQFINRYYVPLLLLIIVIMIMSDPYVGGYSNLVSYIMWGVIGTLLLVKGLLILQSYLRKSLSFVFFSYDDDTLKERFPYARTWFGLVIISLFICSVLIGIILALHIWGYPISMNDVKQAFGYQLFKVGPEEFITPLTLLGMIVFIAAGFLIAFLVNTFIIRTIFILLPVNVGIQNTVMSIVRYLIIFSAFFLSFYWGNLTWLLIALGVVIASLGYIVKEPIADFISYFIILVQRPVKIGDYIVIDDLTSGLVRQITPRSVILRSKNSFSIIVPNSAILYRIVRNWNYSGVFIAFDDIRITIPYNIDPQQVRSIAFKVLDSNPEILKTPKPIIRLEEFGDNGYIFMIRGFVSNARILDIWDIASDIRFALVKALQEQKIYIAYPARMLVKHPESSKADIRPTDIDQQIR